MLSRDALIPKYSQLVFNEALQFKDWALLPYAPHPAEGVSMRHACSPNNLRPVVVPLFEDPVCEPAALDRLFSARENPLGRR
jgi:hypothetical protein